MLRQSSTGQPQMHQKWNFGVALFHCISALSDGAGAVPLNTNNPTGTGAMFKSGADGIGGGIGAGAGAGAGTVIGAAGAGTVIGY